MVDIGLEDYGGSKCDLTDLIPSSDKQEIVRTLEIVMAKEDVLNLFPPLNTVLEAHGYKCLDEKRIEREINNLTYEFFRYTFYLSKSN